MTDEPRFAPRCLTHQMDEDQLSPVGLVCPVCKERLIEQPPRGRCMAFWESQPAAYTPEGDPCFVYSLMWDDYRIRTMHPPECTSDRRPIAPLTLDDALSPDYVQWIDDILRARGESRDPNVSCDD